MVRLNADKHSLSLGIALIDVVNVVRGNERYARLVGKPFELRQYLKLLGQTVILHFKVVVARTENGVVPQRGFLGIFIVVRREVSRNFTRKTGGQRDKSLVIFSEQFPVDSRLYVKTRFPAFGNHFYQIFVTRFVFTKKYKMIALGVDIMHLVKARALRNVNLTADNRLDTLLFGFLIEVYNAEHIAVVGNCNGGL